MSRIFFTIKPEFLSEKQLTQFSQQVSKGQIISKQLLVSSDSSKKRTNTFVFFCLTVLSKLSDFYPLGPSRFRRFCCVMLQDFFSSAKSFLTSAPSREMCQSFARLIWQARIDQQSHYGQFWPKTPKILFWDKENCCNAVSKNVNFYDSTSG